MEDDMNAFETHYSALLSTPTLEGAIHDLETLISAARGLPEPLSQTVPGKWSPKQIIGHLVDSAVNNHQRFVRAQIAAHLKNGALEIDGYAQNEWVAVGGYATRDWNDLLNLWLSLNAQILHVMKHVNPDSLSVPVIIGGGSPAPLEAIMIDYAGHVKHHLESLESHP
jgi:DinB superfamily